MKTWHGVRGLPFSVAAWLAAGWLALASNLLAQQDAGFGDERRVTAIDLMVGFESGAARRWATEREVPKDLAPDRLEVVFGERSRPVVAVDTAPGRWQIVLYFDAVLSTTADLRWAASTLSEKTAEIVALGEVTVVVADPAPRTVLASTRDGERLHATLSQMARSQESQSEILTLRAEVIAALEQGDPEIDADLLAEVARGEARRIRERQDHLLLTLVDAAGEDPRRVVMWAGGDYDLRPMDFYRPLMGQLAGTEDAFGVSLPSADRPPPDLSAATEALARTLAAYGWVVVHLSPPEREVLKPGVRIGKLRLSGPAITYDEDNDRPFFKLFGATYEENRKPERAEALLELAEALETQGKLERAEESLRQAIYYFGGDPKTADRQAIAFAHLGRVLEARGQSQQAAEALGQARDLDPGAVSGPVAGWVDGDLAGGLLARVGNGTTVGGAGALGRTLVDLRHRIRLTYQVDGPPDGDLHTLDVRFDDPAWHPRHPRWARSSIPETVATARALRLLAGELTGGELKVAIDLLPGDGSAAGRPATLALRSLDTAPPPAPRAVLRLTLATAGPDAEPVTEHRDLGPQDLTGVWEFTAEVDLVDERPWLAVLLEDLESGGWTGRLIERF